MADNPFVTQPFPPGDRPITQRRVDKFVLMEQIRARLEIDRSPYEPVWFDIQRILDPHLVIWDMYQAGFPDLVSDLFITSTHLQSFDDLVSGLQEGITPASQVWAKYGLEDEDDPVAQDPKVWNFLHAVTRKFQSILLNSNFYQQTPILYRSVSRFATGAIMMERDPKTFVRFTTFPVGSYFISNNYRGLTDTFCRKFRMKVRQVVEEFCTDADGNIDTSNLSTSTLTMWLDPRRHEEWVNVIMLIFPNPERNDAKGRLNSKYKQYSINYYEYANNIGGKILREEGSDYFPVYCPKWFRQPTDNYGVDSPGYKARADIRRMFKSIEMYLNALQKVIEPPMVADPSVGAVTGGGIGTTPNFLTIAPGGAGQGRGFGPAYQIQPDLKAVSEYIAMCEKSIERLTMADIFRMLGNDERQTPPTATEVMERVQENSRVLGPIFGAFNFDWLQPMARDLYKLMIEEKVIPSAPDNIHMKNLKVEVISRIAIALKQGDINAIDAGMNTVAKIAEIKAQPGTERLNGDEVMDDVFRKLNLSPKYLYDEKQAAKIRQAMNQQKQQQMAAQHAEQLSKTAKNLSAADMGGNTNLLQQMMDAAKNGGQPGLPQGGPA